MKKLTLSLAAVAAMGTFAVAGGDIAPVEPVVDTPVIAPVGNGFYVGAGYSYFNGDADFANGATIDTDFDSIMLQAGYKINPYVAVEARYWNTVGDPSGNYTPAGGSATPIEVSIPDYDMDAWGIYVKPMYPVTDAFDIYALLGYANVDINDNTGKLKDQDGFSWGLGAAYSFNNNWSIFADYTSLYNDDNDNVDYTIDTWNFGVTYKF